MANFVVFEFNVNKHLEDLFLSHNPATTLVGPGQCEWDTDTTERTTREGNDIFPAEKLGREITRTTDKEKRRGKLRH